jgi:vanillate O-demethylase ferredoxin subunit
MSSNLKKVRIQQIRWEAKDIFSYELIEESFAELPVFTAGAHIDLYLPDGKIRSYSLASDPADLSTYVIAIQREDHGRGASKWLHDVARVGTVLPVSTPKNEFELADEADESIFIAGGIGITPILAMIKRLDSQGRKWTLHYATRSREATPFARELDSLAAGRDRVKYSIGGERVNRLNIRKVIASGSNGAHFYCCGPTRMIDEFVTETTSISPAHVHIERFSAVNEAAVEGGFEVMLAKSGVKVKVAPGQRMLDALLDANVSVPYACSNGICGTCLTKVIRGKPDHRDDFLSDDEKALGNSIIVCCSGSLSSELVLDL